jgi:hypothetical protein
MKNDHVASFGRHQMNHRADAHREYQAEALLELYRRGNGRAADNMTELERWCEAADLSAYHSDSGGIDPAKVFTREQSREILDRLDAKYHV